uniref:Uncharacterized protein n=1 Tax=Syphacia muris TaxID=451379 RepID=A0A0N5AQM5_9BILA
MQDSIGSRSVVDRLHCLVIPLVITGNHPLAVFLLSLGLRSLDAFLLQNGMVYTPEGRDFNLRQDLRAENKVKGQQCSSMSAAVLEHR